MYTKYITTAPSAYRKKYYAWRRYRDIVSKLALPFAKGRKQDFAFLCSLRRTLTFNCCAISESSNFSSPRLKNDHEGHFLILAEGERFELSMQLPTNRLSKAAP